MQDATGGGLRCISCEGNLLVLNSGQCGEHLSAPASSLTCVGVGDAVGLKCGHGPMGLGPTVQCMLQWWQGGPLAQTKPPSLKLAAASSSILP